MKTYEIQFVEECTSRVKVKAQSEKKARELNPDYFFALPYGFINEFVNNMLARDSKALRSNIKSVSPDIVMEQEVEIGGETVEVNIPMAVTFFWPSTRT